MSTTLRSTILKRKICANQAFGTKYFYLVCTYLSLQDSNSQSSVPSHRTIKASLTLILSNLLASNATQAQCLLKTFDVVRISKQKIGKHGQRLYCAYCLHRLRIGE